MRINIKPCPFCGGVVRVYAHPVARTVSFVCENCDMDTHFDGIDSIPDAVEEWNKRESSIDTVDAVKHGRWMTVDWAEPRRYGCSECHRMVWQLENFCPNCGARMDGEENG